ncbi:hypothetical protein D3C80_1604420 [compost metagenome]
MVKILLNLMIIFGQRSSHIASFSIPAHSCNYCGTDGQMTMSFYGLYAHVYWVPMFSVGRSVVTTCMHCKQVLEENQFSPEVKNTRESLRQETKIPFTHFIGLGIIGAVLLAVTVL